MADAHRLDDLQAANLLNTQNVTGSVNTPSGSWIDISNYEGDIAVVVDVGAVTGTGTVNIQVQSSAANTGASPTSETDPRGTLAQPAAAGAVVLFLDVNTLANKFMGVAVTLTGVTGVLLGVVLVGRKRSN